MSEKETENTNTNEEETSRMNEEKERPEEAPEEPRNRAETEAGEIETDIEKLQAQLEEANNQTSSFRDQLLRLAAEFENFRRRTESEKAEFVKYSHEKLIKDLLPVLDDFERALENGKKNTDFESFYTGVEMIYQKLRKAFEEKGVKPIESLGKEFDVAYHDVLMQMERPDVPPHTIVQEVEKGYTLHGKVIKHAKVIVAAEQPAGSGKGEGPETDPQK